MQEDIALLVLPCGETIGLSEQRFRFSNTAHEFDDHIGKSIRGYHDLRDDIVGISRHFAEDNTAVADIGCSQGSMIRHIRVFCNHNTYLCCFLSVFLLPTL